MSEIDVNSEFYVGGVDGNGNIVEGAAPAHFLKDLDGNPIGFARSPAGFARASGPDTR